MKRFGLAALLVVRLGLVASTPALAQTMPVPVPVDWGTLELENTDVEANARGLATLENVQFAYSEFNPYVSTYATEVYRGDLTVKCQGLTPGKTYSTCAGVFKVDRKGDGSVTGSVERSLFGTKFTTIPGRGTTTNGFSLAGATCR
jgi:hypothetical protein